MKQAKHFLLTATLLLCSLAASAYDFEVDGIYYDVISKEDMTVEVSSFFSSKADVVIPSTVTYNSATYRVISIGDYAFNYSYDLVSVLVPESVISIGDDAFNRCTSLTTITFPENSQLTSIGDDAFRDCSSLTSIAIPEGVASIGDYAFRDCNSLTSFTIPEDVTSIGYHAFSGCNKIELVTLNCASVGDWFSENKAIKEIVLGESVSSIGTNAFYGCTGLTSITIPEGVTEIGASAFASCSNLASITFPESLSRVGYSAFYGTPWLYSQRGVVYAGKVLYGYYGTCPNDVVVEEGTKSISDFAFERSGIRSIVIPGSVASIGEYAFCSCYTLTSVTLGEGVEVLGYYAFAGCSMTEIYIPASVTSVASRAFSGCNQLISIIVDGGNDVYDSREGCNAVIETHSNNLVAGCGTTIIPYGVKSIGEFAFENLRGLTSITIPESVTSIGWYAFLNCSSLTSITIPESVSRIGASAFGETRWYSNLPDGIVYAGKVLYGYKGTMPQNTSIEVREGTLGISEGAFRDYMNLTDITIPKSVTTIGGDAFEGTAWYEGLPDGLVYIGSVLYKYKGRTTEPDDFSIEVKEGTTCISGYAFKDCSDLRAVTIPEGVTVIGPEAFRSCDLTEITLPKSLEEIGCLAFGSCMELTSLTCHAENPPICAYCTFLENPAGLVLYVPKKSVPAYQIAAEWRNFKNIVSIEDATEIDNTELIGSLAAGKSGSEFIYDLSGRRVEKAEKGIYIVNGKKVVF